ncbi:hypothetical protein [Pelagerythrobacter sp.]|uniref:hypothetical protein n=1 Tax=Pelagerythrobacter sp. TaxID=2800702 RepID=UPI0035B1AC19
MQTERVTYLTNAEQKAALEAFAKARGVSVGNVLREAAAQYMEQPTSEEEAELAAIIAEVAKAVPEMQASLRRSAKMLEQSRVELDRKLRDAGIRK